MDQTCSLKDWLNSQNIKFPIFFPNIEVSNPEVKIKSIGEVQIGCDVVLSQLLMSPDVIFSALLSLVDQSQTVPITITGVVNSNDRKDDNKGKKDSKFVIEIHTGKISIPTGIGASIQLDNTELIATVKPLADPISATFMAKGNFSIPMFNQQHLDAKLTMSVTEKNDLAQADVGLVISNKAGIEMWPSELSKFIILQDLGGSMGVQFDPPGCQLGVEAQVKFKNNPKGIRTANGTLVIDLEGDAPVPIYLSSKIEGRVTPIDLWSIFFTKIGLDLPDVVEYDSPSMSYCAQTVFLPNGTTALPGFSFSGLCRVLDVFRFYGALHVKDDLGMKGTFEAEKINWRDIFKVSGNGKGIPEKDITTKTGQKIAAGSMMPAGGAELTFDFDAEGVKAELTIDIVTSFLDSPPNKTSAKVSEEGIKFNIDLQGLATMSAAFCLNNNGLTGGFIFNSPNGIPMPIVPNLGNFSVGPQGVGLEITIYPENLLLSVGISINQNGKWKNLGSLSEQTTVQIETLEDLKKAVFHYITNTQFLLSLLQSFNKNPQLWFDAMTAEELLPLELGAKAAVKCLDQLGVPGKDLATWINQLDDQFNLVKNEGLKQVAEAIKLVYPDVKHMGTAVYALAKDGQHPARTVVKILHELDIPSSGIAEVFHILNLPVSVATDAFRAALSTISPQEIGQILASGGYKPQDLVNAFKKMGGDFAKAAEAAAKSLEHDLNPKNWF